MGKEMENDRAVNKSFVFIHVNAMRLGNPNAIFTAILGSLPGAGKVAASLALSEVQRFFYNRTAADPVIVLLIDEIDQLVTKSQSVLYSVFEWLSYRDARLVVMAISNTMDLPERLLPRVASRFEIVRVDFWPYTKHQILQILKTRLHAHDADDVFKQEALIRCSARVACGTGDVRKALQLCRRAIEIRIAEVENSEDKAIQNAEEFVEGKHLEEAVKALLFTNPSTSRIAGLSVKARRFLLAVMMELRHKEADVVPFRQTAIRYEKLMHYDNEEAPSSGSHTEDAESLANNLASMHLIVQQRGAFQSKGADQGYALALGETLDAEDLKTALRGAETDAGFLKLLED